MNEVNTTAVFLNIASIQEYIFNSNKLKSIIGASYIVKTLFENYPKIKEKINANLGYFGGGNCLLTGFVTRDDAVSFVKEFSLFLLVNYPGIKLKAGIIDDFVNTADIINPNDALDKQKTYYQDSLRRIIYDANKKYNKHQPVTSLPKHGFTADCPWSNLGANVEIKLEQNKRIVISDESFSKIEKWEEIQKEDNKTLYNAGMNNFEFAYEFEHLAKQKEEDSHLAIISIDGNGFRDKFQQCKELNSTIKLSSNTKAIVNEAFVTTLTELKTFKCFSNFVRDGESESQKILQIRPVILGGDDITLVVNSRLSIWLAQRFIKNFEKTAKKYGIEGTTACAGICVTNIKYPFFRGYSISNELCKNAKTRSRKEAIFDFHYASSDIRGDIETIRNTQYRNLSQGYSLLKRPYSDKELTELIKNAISLSNIEKKWIGELRTELYKNEASRKKFRLRADFRDKSLPLKDAFKEDFFDGKNETPFFDMIEMLDLIDPKLFEKE